MLKSTKFFVVLFAMAGLFLLSACGGQHDDLHHHDHDHHGHNHDHDHGHSHSHHTYDFLIEGEEGYINIYSSRHFLGDEAVFGRFTEATGIGVNLIHTSSGHLVERLRMEGAATLADLVITADGGIISFIKSEGLLQPVSSDVLHHNVPERFRDSDGYWFALSYRARVLAMVEHGLVSTYQDMVNHSVLLRPGGHLYNMSLLASIIDIYGFDHALQWARGLRDNAARSPQGNDRDQLAGLAAGLGDAAFVNSYYLGLLLNSSNPEEVAVGEAMHIVFPNQDSSGVHINISAMGVPYYASNVEGALAFMEFVTSAEAQNFLVEYNYEFAVNPHADVPYILQGFLPFAKQDIDFNELHRRHGEAMQIISIVGW